MSLLAKNNTTCDIYRFNHSPPADMPDVAGVKIYLQPKGQSTLTTIWYTHVALVDATVDIRDNMQISSGVPTIGPNADNIYVPDKNGTKFQVVLVRRVARSTAGDMKQVLLFRTQPTYPTDNV
jgi:hypothetical protein